MTMEEELRALLTGESSITLIAPSSQINWGAHPQGMPYPAIVLNLVSGTRGYHQQGPDGLERSRVQIDVYSESYADAKNLARLVESHLSGHKGGGFGGIFLQSIRESREGGTNEATRPYRVQQDFSINWRATT